MFSSVHTHCNTLVGPYLGLVPGAKQSGKSDPQKRISKHGNEMTRKLLVNCAHYVLGPFGEDCDLRRHGEKIAQRGGGNAKKRAVVAVARKLSVLLHRLWVDGEVYEPLYNAPAAAKAKKLPNGGSRYERR
jgi:transposase